MNRFLLIVVVMLMHGMIYSQGSPFANISSKQFIFQAEINKEPFAFVSDDFYVQLNNRTGEFTIEVGVSSLYYSKINPMYRGHNEFEHECFQITGEIPLNTILQQGDLVYETAITSTIIFDGKRFETEINFKILNRFPNGFVFIAESNFPQSYFSIADPKEAPQDAVLHINFYAN